MIRGEEIPTEVLCDKKIPLKLKGKFYRAAIRPAMLYGSECWAMKKSLESKLEAAEMRMLRWSCGRTMMDRIPNRVFRNVLEVAPISAKVREGRLRWFVHVRRRLASAPIMTIDRCSWRRQIRVVDSFFGNGSIVESLKGAVGRFDISSVRAECSESVVVNSP
ncbi:hypothetical protein OROGR_013005 [Orobanche gracilis]